MRSSVVTSAVVAALVGFGGTLALIVAAAQAVGATPAQTASGVIGLCLSMAATSAWLGWNHRIPIITAWSTPGAALVAGSHGLTAQTAVGAFLVAGALILVTAAVRPLGALVQRLPVAIAAAMLAGVLFRFCTSVFTAAEADPLLVLPLIVIFLVARRINPFGAVLAVLVIGISLAFMLGRVGPLPGPLQMPAITIVLPSFEMQALIGVAVPLYIVTMASQNLPGFAVLQAAGYTPPTQSILAVTGIASLITAPLGSLTSNLAAITASICTGPDTHPDPARRWPATSFYALSYLVLAIGGASLVALIGALPAGLVATFAGLALLGPLVGALGTAMGDTAMRFPAVLTLAVTASGVSLLGIGSAFWGLMAGLAALGIEHAGRR
ncbi:benzoate/H(+) symporter BenE family transporter [Ancylobacter pratisalsi]|uniref:Benzoate/H(+) symporter BenE family transporter n=1 Tax=Ancylobacter pratisalsi TaxID=1745854 RepID=A0A6P1YGR8_9HYPH|nr:benzoate/H(+) symporter BenE family transporter [Ancylobacter pratisalsi]QIB32498.1 benzoate/H(+) symporter BenE family transporter [Ancylobacter pratisalsi]